MKSRSLAEFNEEKMQMRKLTKLHDNSMKKLCYKREERNAVVAGERVGRAKRNDPVEINK